MDPPTALLNSNRTPLIFREEAILREKFGDFRRKHHMPVLKSVIEILVGVLDLTHF
jgi:hypothetical protein